jgi:alkanesulfonate monooxygenase SsuD/methylene tetrahydromethanopterin reductase-like flavin-dependent oxidoreductase (luciferase family)
LNQLRLGLNLNNREALIAPDYSLHDLLALGTRAEELGFDSVWVGDSLFSKPRYEPLTILAALSQRTRTVELGTSCLVTSQRHPVQLAHAWATLDVLAGGRTILGACSGNIAEEAVKREFAALGLDHRNRMSLFEEGLAALRQLLESGRVELDGERFQLELAFHTGTEPAPLLPARTPPIWVVANPAIGRSARVALDRAARRVARLGDGWLTCCRARHPEEVREFVAALGRAQLEDGCPQRDLEVAYQVTMVLGDTREGALASQRAYIDAYYPGFADAVDLADWGPAGTAATVAEWLQEFAAAGVTTAICRFAALDQPGQAERFAREVMPELERAGLRAG